MTRKWESLGGGRFGWCSNDGHEVVWLTATNPDDRGFYLDGTGYLGQGFKDDVLAMADDLLRGHLP